MAGDGVQGRDFVMTEADIDRFYSANSDAIKTAVKFVKRAERGLPYDRWATLVEQEQVARGIKALLVIIEMQHQTIGRLVDE
jgi:hypothetical protein